MEETAFGWHSRRSDAQYVDFHGSDLSVPSKNFDREDAEKMLEDAEAIPEDVRERADIDIGNE